MSVYTEKELNATCIDEAISLLNKAKYLTESESTYHPEMVPIKENTRLGKKMIRLEDFVEYAFSNGNADANTALKARVEKLIPVYEEALANVKALENQDAQDFLARRLYDMTAELVMSLLIIRDAAKAPELFEKSANVYVRMTEEDVLGKSVYIKNFKVEDLDSFRAC